MSDIASRWAFEQRLRGLQKPVLMALGFRHNGITGACFPSVSTIGEDAGFISDDSVRRALKELSRGKLISVIERWDGPNRLSNSYTLHFAGVPAHSEGVPAVCEGGTRTEQGGYSLTAGRAPAHSDPNKELNKGTQQGTEQKSNAERGNVLATLLLKGKGEYLVCEDDLAKHQRAFPRLDIQNEYRRMELWCADNPNDRKTASGIHRFMSGWLSRAPKETDAKAGKCKPGTNRAQQNRDFTKQGIAESFTELFGANLGDSDGTDDSLFPSPACSEGNDEGMGGTMGGTDSDLWPGGFHGRTISGRA